MLIRRLKLITKRARVSSMALGPADHSIKEHIAERVGWLEPGKQLDADLNQFGDIAELGASSTDVPLQHQFWFKCWSVLKGTSFYISTF
jgi:hypothetical protein